MIRWFLRLHPGIRWRVKLWLLDHAMIIAAQLADDVRRPARERQEYGRRTMQIVRWHQRLSRLGKPS